LKVLLSLMVWYEFAQQEAGEYSHVPRETLS